MCVRASVYLVRACVCVPDACVRVCVFQSKGRRFGPRLGRLHFFRQKRPPPLRHEDKWRSSQLLALLPVIVMVAVPHSCTIFLFNYAFVVTQQCLAQQPRGRRFEPSQGHEDFMNPCFTCQDKQQQQTNKTKQRKQTKPKTLLLVIIPLNLNRITGCHYSVYYNSCN